MPKIGDICPPALPDIAEGSPRFRIHAFIDPDGVKKPNVEGWARTGDVYGSCPAKARFIVVETVDGEFQVWRRETLAQTTINIAPPPEWRGNSVDAMVMKALALYDR